MSVKGQAAVNPNAWAVFDNLKQVDKMSKEELQRECQSWRTLWTYIPQEMQGWLCQIGQECIFVTRNNDRVQGRYMDCKVTVTGHTIQAYERMYDQVKKEMFIYKTEAFMPLSHITDIKFIKETYEDEIAK